MTLTIEKQQHGYKDGHQLLETTVSLSRSDQDVIDRLSDMAGTLSPGEKFAPYLTGYPLPSNKYYVLARTWQDLDAPRVGCVVTYSLLVPMKEWVLLKNIPSLSDALNDRDKFMDAPLIDKASSSEFGDVNDLRVNVLAEALFLESRKPIVMFESFDAEAITLRLLSSLWPGVKEKFCVCTYALSPRTLNGRAFDLIFAPKTARARFADWSGRRIEVNQAKNITSRHRWSEIISDQIFTGRIPHLASLEATDLFNSDHGDLEAKLRLSLMWGDLLERSQKSPTAVLGMLDILTLEKDSFYSNVKKIEPIIERALFNADLIPDLADAWQFLSTIIGKFPARSPSSILRQLRGSAARLARSNPEIAFDFLRMQERSNKIAPTIILTGIADGIADSIGEELILDRYSNLSAHDSLSFIALSKLFSKMFFATTASTTNQNAIHKLANFMATSEVPYFNQARRNILEYIRYPCHAPLLDAVLNHTDFQNLINAIEKIKASSGFEIPEFNDSLKKAAQDLGAMDYLRLSIATAKETATANDFLIETFSPELDHIEWLLESSVLSESRRVNILRTLVAQAPDGALTSLASQQHLADKIIDLLDFTREDSAFPLSRLLVSGTLTRGQNCLIGKAILNKIPEQNRRKLARDLLMASLGDAVVHESEMIQLIEIVEGEIDLDLFILQATTSEISVGSFLRNIQLMKNLNDGLKSGVLSRIDAVVKYSLSRSEVPDDSQLAASLSLMILQAEEINFEAQGRASALALSFAVRHRRPPWSDLVTTSFPIVYKSLSFEQSAPSMFFLFTLADWDKRKVARKELVKVFMSSTWPPADLLICAYKAGITTDVLSLVLNERNGDKYLRQIKKDVARLPKHVQEIFSKVL